MTHHISNNNDNTLNIISDDVVDLQSSITTNTSNITSATFATISNQAQINTLNANLLFTDCIKFNINGAYVYTAGGGNTGSSLSTTNPLTTTPRRYILLREDTYDSDVVLSDDNTTFTPNESGMYLSIISAEFYDGSADTKIAQIELIEKMGSSESSRQIARNTFTGTSTSFEFGRLNSTAVVILTAGKDYWYKAIGSANGGVINAFSTTTNFTLIKLGKSF